MTILIGATYFFYNFAKIAEHKCVEDPSVRNV
jgi:hypothetical protein